MAFKPSPSATPQKRQIPFLKHFVSLQRILSFPNTYCCLPTHFCRCPTHSVVPQCTFFRSPTHFVIPQRILFFHPCISLFSNTFCYSPIHFVIYQHNMSFTNTICRSPTPFVVPQRHLLFPNAICCSLMFIDGECTLLSPDPPMHFVVHR